jgi:hypothetical protein
MIPGSMSLGFVFVLVLALFSLYGCNDGIKMDSQWCTESIQIDGDVSEWPETNQYFAKKPNVLIAVLNDRDNIYIRLLTRSKTTQLMILRDGLTIWIDESGRNEKKFGLHFPLVKETHESNDIHNHKPENTLQEIIKDGHYSMALLESSVGGHHSRIVSGPEAAKMGFQAHLGVNLDYLVYELQIPNRTSPDNNIVSIGFESGETQKRPDMDRPDGGMPGGPNGPPGGRPPKGGMPGGSPHGNAPPESLQMWATVKLVNAPEVP